MNEATMQRAAFDEAAKALKRRECSHEWKKTARTWLPDGRGYLTRRCVQCDARKLRGAGTAKHKGY